MNRVLGLDFGEKRVGVAYSDLSKTFAQTGKFLDRQSNGFFDQIEKLINDLEIAKIIVGNPKTLKGKDSQSTINVRKFVRELKARFSIPVKTWDERLSTVSAENILNQMNVKGSAKRREKIDSLSAQIFLQNYLDYINRRK